MHLIARMRTRYDSRQDRIVLTVLDAEGRSRALWLTQRFAGRLVAALIGQLDRLSIEAPGAKAAGACRGTAPSGHPADRTRRDGVRQPAEEPRLVTDAVIRRSGNGLFVVFKWSRNARDCAALSADRNTLRKWLGIVHARYRQAEWPVDVWPQAFRQPAPERIPSRKHMH